MRLPILLIGATLLLLSVGCGAKKPRYVVTATDVSNRVLTAPSQRSAEPVARLRESVVALRQRLAQEKTSARAPVVPPDPPVTGTSGLTATTPQATGTVGTTGGIPSESAASTESAAPTQPTTTTGVPPAGSGRRQAGSRPVWLALMVVAVIGVLLLTRRRSVH